MNGNRNRVFTDSGIIEAGNGFLGALLIVELDIAKSSALSIGEDFEFTRTNLSVLLEEIHECLLINVFGQVSDNDVGLLVKILLFLFVEHDLFAVDGLVVHLFHASPRFFLFNEVEVSKSKRFVRLFIEHHLGTLNFVSFACKEFVEVQVIGLL